MDFVGLFTLLAAGRIRFVVVGGLALLLHGLDRLTADVDLAIDLSTDATQDAVRALTEAGCRPLAPVDPMSLADPDQRRAWQTTHGMQVFSFWDTANTIGGVVVRIASIRHLIRMKQAAGRPQDIADVERLRSKLTD